MRWICGGGYRGHGVEVTAPGSNRLLIVLKEAGVIPGSTGRLGVGFVGGDNWRDGGVGLSLSRATYVHTTSVHRRNVEQLEPQADLTVRKADW